MPAILRPRLLSIIYSSCSQLPLIPMRGAAAVCAKTRRTGSRRWEAAAHYNGNKNNVVHSWRVRLFTAATTTRHFHKQTFFARFAFACLDSSAWPRLRLQQQQQQHQHQLLLQLLLQLWLRLRLRLLSAHLCNHHQHQAVRQPGSHPVLVRNILVVDATPPHPYPLSPSPFTFISVISPALLCTKHIFHFRFHSGPENEASQAKPSQAGVDCLARQSKARQGKAHSRVVAHIEANRIESSRVLAASLFQHAARCLSI